MTLKAKFQKLRGWGLTLRGRRCKYNSLHRNYAASEWNFSNFLNKKLGKILLVYFLNFGLPCPANLINLPL